MVFKPMTSITIYFPAYEILSNEKALKIQALMGVKPMTKYSPASDISKKVYEILKQRAYGISKEKTYNILAFMGFKPITSITKSFPTYEISKGKSFKIQALMGFKPMTKYSPASEISTKGYEILKKRVLVYQRRKSTTFWLSWDLNP